MEQRQTPKNNGLAYLSMSDGLMKRYVPGLEPPVWGPVGMDFSLQVQQDLCTIQQKICLPEPFSTYKVVGVFYGVLQRQWYIMYEHPDIPVPPPSVMVPEIVVTYSHDPASESLQMVSAELRSWA